MGLARRHFTKESKRRASAGTITFRSPKFNYHREPAPIVQLGRGSTSGRARTGIMCSWQSHSADAVHRVSGEPALAMSLSAFFSAAEVIALTFTLEAWSFLQLGAVQQSSSSAPVPRFWAACSSPRPAFGISSSMEFSDPSLGRTVPPGSLLFERPTQTAHPLACF
jgi:hypothetical protein